MSAFDSKPECAFVQAATEHELRSRGPDKALDPSASASGGNRLSGLSGVALPSEPIHFASSRSLLKYLVYNALVSFVKPDPTWRRGRRTWEKLWSVCARYLRGPVHTRIHGYPVVVNYGYTYPIYARLFRSLNNPLIELVYQAHNSRGRSLFVADIGAAVGDTILLLKSNCPDIVNGFLCVDGDTEFFGYLRENLKGMQDGYLVNALLSATDSYLGELVRIHSGTASAQGSRTIPCTTLDVVLEQNRIRQLDVLKVDVDGFDGRVLVGCQRTLNDQRPEVVFEWHPGLCIATGNSPFEHFEALIQCNYDRFIWFTKYGEFSHFMDGFDRTSVERLVTFCRDAKTYVDWHYDVIALHRLSPLSSTSLADSAYAKQRRSSY